MISGLEKTEIENHVMFLYRKSALTNPEKRLEWMHYNLEELEKENDPFIAIASDIESELAGLRKEMELLEFQQDELTKIYSGFLLEMNQNRIAPDANSTIRFTYGPIKGYSPADGIYYLPQTTLSGTIAKNQGEYPFNVPAKIIELFKKKDFGRYMDERLKDVPACFLNTTNVTGGNSGSPTLNARGELIGVIFDMTYESIIGDYYIIPELQRTISVDIRYILFITEKFAGATFLLEEMNL
jgi:hypothetical protein